MEAMVGQQDQHARAQRYDAILFDLDNTLYDYDAYWRERLAWSLEPVVQCHPQLDIPALIAEIIAQRVYASQIVAFLQQRGVDMQVCASAHERYTINDFSTLLLYPDVPYVLRTLRAHYKMGLITNGPARTQRPKIDQFGLVAWMDVLIVSEEAQVAKPNPAIFHLALNELGVAPARALYVGDSLEHDLVGALRAGLDFVWMNPHLRTLPPDMPPPLADIPRLDLLLSLLDALAPQQPGEDERRDD
jgi:HAD superfamily hydrolase (TIGR01509 family)